MVEQRETTTTSLSGSQQASRARGGSKSSSSASCSSLGVIESSLRQHERLHLAVGEEEVSPLGCFLRALTRKKPLDCRTDTNLNRCLGLLDLTVLGVGSTLGLGLYVLAGQVASSKAGPAVVISFALAGLASAFSALCYAEFAGRVPRAGSAYAYSYITVGEFVAFIIGWNMILEYVIGASSVARGFSGYLRFVVAPGSLVESPTCHLVAPNATRPAADFAANSSATPAGAGWLAPPSLEASSPAGSALLAYLAEYFDWPSLVIVAVVTVLLLVGVKQSTNIALVFTSLNLVVVVTVVLSSLGSLDMRNWRLAEREVPACAGRGGFLPFGWSGVLAGSATCFFGFIGFDTIASSAEEAKNPRRNVPLSIILSLVISALAYVAIALVQTLLWPYHDQNRVTVLPYIFERLNMPLVYWVVLLGASAGLASSQLSGMYPLPRILYSIAQDKLIYGYLAHVNKRLRLPVRATLVGSLLVGVLACLLDIESLADMVSIGTLAAYSLVSVSVLILRYENRADALDDSTILSNHLALDDILTTTSSSASAGLALSKQPAPEQPTSQRAKLGPKQSTPIRENGSRALVPQLSIGFQSWFEHQPAEGANGAAEPEEPSASGARRANGKLARKVNQRRTYVSLLIGWRSEGLNNEDPDEQSSHQSKVLISLIVLLTIFIDLVGLWLSRANWSIQTIVSAQLLDSKVLLSCSGCIALVVLAALLLMLSRLPTGRQNKQSEMFIVPLVPLIPTLSILVNTFLMLNLGFLTWVRFTVWMSVGLFIYFTYGIWNSEGYLLHLDR